MLLFLALIDLFPTENIYLPSTHSGQDSVSLPLEKNLEDVGKALQSVQLHVDRTLRRQNRQKSGPKRNSSP